MIATFFLNIKTFEDLFRFLFNLLYFVLKINQLIDKLMGFFGFFLNRYNLGKVLEAMGDYDLAARSYSTALEVQKSSPVAPFSAVPLCFE